MCPNKLQEIHHYRVAKSFACFPCHPLNGNRRKFFRYDLLNDSIPTAFQMLQCGQRLRRDFFFNFGLFCTGCILSQIVKLPSVFPSRRTGQHTNCMKSAVRFLHRKCDFVLLDIDLERFIFQRFLINVKKEFLSLICQLTGIVCRKTSIFCQREKQTGHFGQLKDIQKLKPIIRSQAAYAPPEVVDGKPPIYPYAPIKSSFEDAGSVEEMMVYTELQSAVHAMIQRLEYSFTFNPTLLTIPKRKQQVAEILEEAEKYIWRIKEEMRCA